MKNKMHKTMRAHQKRRKAFPSVDMKILKVTLFK